MAQQANPSCQSCCDCTHHHLLRQCLYSASRELSALTLPHDDCGLSSISCVSSTFSPLASASARPQLQFLQALRAPPAPTSQSSCLLTATQHSTSCAKATQQFGTSAGLTSLQIQEHAAAPCWPTMPHNWRESPANICCDLRLIRKYAPLAIVQATTAAA